MGSEIGDLGLRGKRGEKEETRENPFGPIWIGERVEMIDWVVLIWVWEVCDWVLRE